MKNNFIYLFEFKIQKYDIKKKLIKSFKKFFLYDI